MPADISLWLAISVAVLTALFSGLVGAMLSVVVYARREDRRFKVETLKRFAANRYHITGPEFSQALNEVAIVFDGHKEVMDALQVFHDRISEKKPGQPIDLSEHSPANNALVKLYKAMCRAAEVKYEHFNDSFFLRPFGLPNATPPVIFCPAIQPPQVASGQPKQAP